MSVQATDSDVFLFDVFGTWNPWYRRTYFRREFAGWHILFTV